MILTEINPKGNFEAWTDAKLAEIRNNNFSETIGTILYEDDGMKLWEIFLKPSERIPFRIHRNCYSCTSFSDGLLISRNIDGQVFLARIKKGGTIYRNHSDEPIIQDLENIGENSIRITVVEEKVLAEDAIPV